MKIIAILVSLFAAACFISCEDENTGHWLDGADAVVLDAATDNTVGEAVAEDSAVATDVTVDAGAEPDAAAGD